MSMRQAWILLIAGLAQAASLAWPFPVGIPGWLEIGQASGTLQVLALGVLAFHLRASHTVRHAFLRSWLFVTAWLVGTFWWLFISMNSYGGLPSWLAGAAVLALAAALGLYYAVMLACAVRWTAWWPVSFACAWTLAELMRGQWFTGFPWGAVGYAHVDSSLRVLAPWVGVYGVGWLAAYLAACAALVLPRILRAVALVISPHGVNKLIDSNQRGCGDLCLGVVIALLWAVPWLHAAVGAAQWGQPAGEISVGLLQGNIAQEEKFQERSGVPQALAWYAQAVRETPAQLVLAPETAIPLLPNELPTNYLTDLVRSLPSAPQGRAVLLGIPLGDLHRGYTNSVLGFSAQTQPENAATFFRYDKHHLVPFGEFIPTFFRWFTRMMHIPLGDFERGGAAQASFDWLGQRLAPTICYEDLFGEELALRFADASRAPTLMVNLSNIGWFGNTVAIDQHLHISRMRVLEFQRPMIRATNTGASAVIDHLAIVTSRLPHHVQTVGVSSVQGRQGEVTPFAAWVGVWGLWPLWLVCAAGLAVVVSAHYWRLRCGKCCDRL